MSRFVSNIIDFEFIETKAGFDPNQERNPDGTWGSGGTSGDEKPKCTEEEFLKNSKVKNEDGTPRVMYHGTTHEFDEFKDSRGTTENNWGIGNYFTSSYNDASTNYGGVGPDLKIRIERQVGVIMQEEGIEDETEAYNMAYDRMVGGEGKVMEFYLNVENPFVIGSSKETKLTYDWDEETGEETGTAIEFWESLRSVARKYSDVDIQTLQGDFFEAVNSYEGAYGIMQKIRGSEGLMYAMDDNAFLSGSQILREAIEDAGFDGIIDNTVAQKFRNMEGLYSGDSHVITFDSNQSKLTSNETFCSDSDVFTKFQKEILELKAGFDPNQQRQADGKWGSGGDNVKNISEKLSKLSELPKAPPNKTDKHGRILEGKVHLYHSTNGIENLNNIVSSGVDLSKQTAVEGLFFAKLGSPYRKYDSFVVLEMDIEDVPWSNRFIDSEVAFGKVPSYKMVLASKLSPEDLRTIKMLNRALNKNGLEYLEKSLANYNKYNGADNEVNKVIRSIVDSEKNKAKKFHEQIAEIKAGFKPTQRRDKTGKWTDKWGQLKQDEQEIKDQDFETALLYDKDGNRLNKIKGNKDAVPLAGINFRDVEVLSHNHPNSSSFSMSDLYLLINEKLNRIRAIGPEGITYEMTLKKPVIGGRWRINDAWEQAKSLADKEVKSYIAETFGPDWETPYFRDNDTKIKEAQKLFGRWSDRTNYYLVNSTDFGKEYFIYKKSKK